MPPFCPSRRGPPSLARGWPGSSGCRELPSPALGPGELEGILGGALGPQPSTLDPGSVGNAGHREGSQASRGPGQGLGSRGSWSGPGIVAERPSRAAGTLGSSRSSCVCWPPGGMAAPQARDGGNAPAHSFPALLCSATVPQLSQPSPLPHPHPVTLEPSPSAPLSLLWAQEGPPSWLWSSQGERLHLGPPRTPLQSSSPALSTPLPSSTWPCLQLAKLCRQGRTLFWGLGVRTPWKQPCFP